MLLTSHELRPEVIIADQQRAFALDYYVFDLAKLNIRLKLIPRDRHREFNSIVEKSQWHEQVFLKVD